MKKKHAQHENHERWLVSYADFITLLFAFFVVMFASSQTDHSKAKQVSEAVQAALENGKTIGVPPVVAKILGGTVGDTGQGNAMMKGPGGAQHSPKEAVPDEVVELLPSLQKLNKELEKELHEGQLEMHMETRGLVVSLREATFFPSGDDQIGPKSYPILDKLGAVIKAIPNNISLEGHADATPIHTNRFRNNWDLSAARSIAALDVIRDRYDIDGHRLSIAAYADMMPVASNDTPEGRARNRRVDIVIKNMTVRVTKAPEKAPAARPASHK